MNEQSGTVIPARNAVMAVFVLNGFGFASLFSRVPDIRSGLDLDNGALGLLLLVGAAGSVLALPSAGSLIRRTSAATVVRTAAVLVSCGLLLVATGVDVLGSVGATAVGLFVYGVGTGVWDVAMNVEGAAVERGLGRAILPRFHAGWSVGSVSGAGVGVLVTALGVPITGHLALAAIVVLAALPAARTFLPVEPEEDGASTPGSAWREPRTLLIGLMVLAFALTEGAANDWLALALIDGYEAPGWVGVAGFAVFVVAMTIGRVLGTVVLDRFGRVRVLRATCLLALAGLLLLVLGQHPVLVGLGVVAWGLGASLGFPVGMSAGADDPARAAARVSVVSTIGYSAFLAGPPILGFVADQVGTLESLLVVAVLLVPTTFLVSVAKEPA
ncbi:MAG: MFS transporter, partial [Nocardioides sp.]